MSETEKSSNSASCGFRTSIGGQALIEGIMMRGPKRQSIVCRTKDGLVEKVEELKWVKDKYPILGWPFIRGCAVFLDSMIKGVQALSYSAELVPDDEDAEPDKVDEWVEKHFTAEKAQKIIIGIAVVLGIGLSVVLFAVLPTFIAGFIKSVHTHYFARNLIEGGFRIVIFLLYRWLCSRMEDRKRRFSYHGAEHKTIFCYEHGKPLTADNVRPESRFHPRCGTSSLFVVIIISILVNSVVQVSNTWARGGIHIPLTPVVVGISYEINRWCGRHDNWLSAGLSAPGKWLQRLTTNEPGDSMIECAIRALELVVPEEKGADAW